MANEKKDGIRFEVITSKSDRCLCNACHNIGKVVKIRLPDTHFNKHGTHLNTSFIDYWLCIECRDKLAKALEQEGKR